MTMLMYSLSLIPIIIIALTVHELGHLLTAKFYRVKTSGFQVGIGPTLLRRYTGRTVCSINRETVRLNRRTPPPQPGDIISVYIEPATESDAQYHARAIIPCSNKIPLPKEEWAEVRGFNESHMQLTGKITRITEDRMQLADMAWKLKLIPLMAGVIAPEDPQGKIDNAINNAPWLTKMAIYLAGITANIVLFILALLAVAFFPVQTPEHLLTVTDINPGSPADRANIPVGSQIIQANYKMFPTQMELREITNQALNNGNPVYLTLVEETGERQRAAVIPDAATGLIGITLTPTPSNYGRQTSGNILARIKSLSVSYVKTTARIFTEERRNEPQQEPIFSGPVLASYQTGQYVQQMGLSVWLLILATINLSAAVVNAIPFPPLDGYRMVKDTIQSIRGGKMLSRRVENGIELAGMMTLGITAIYLIFRDISLLTP